MEIQKQKAITLIALVITIIILLIIAGVTIAQLTGENGLIAKVEKARINHLKAQAKEDIELTIMNIQLQDTQKRKTTTLETLNEDLPLENEKIEVDEYEEESKQITGIYNTGKEQFEFIIDDKFKVIIGEKITGTSNKFGIEITEIGQTSFKIEAKAEDLKDVQITKFTYVVQRLDDSKIEIKDITEISYTVTELEPGTEYKVYMLAYDNEGNEIKSTLKKVTTKDFKKPEIIPSTTNWTNQNITITVDFKNDDENIIKEISIDGGKTYKEYTEPVEIESNTTIKARISDETASKESELEIKNIDKLASEILKITSKNTDTGAGIIITVEAKDAEETEQNGCSGIKKYEYYIKEENETEYTKYDSNEVTDLAIGTYNFYVIVYDEAGNTTQSAVNEARISKKIAHIYAIPLYGLAAATDEEEGQLWCWGGDMSSNIYNSLPYKCGNYKNCRYVGFYINVSTFYTDIIDENGLYNYAQNYDTEYKYYKKVVAAKNSEWTYAIDESGNLLKWSRGRYGSAWGINLTNLVSGTKFKDVQVGDGYQVALDVDGNLYTWGQNNYRTVRRWNNRK